MGASLLPNAEFVALCGKAIVAAAPLKDAAGGEVAKEFGIEAQNSWFLVLDGKGETLARFSGDKAGAGCTKESASEFPAKIAAKLAEALKGSESVEELERRWQKDPAQAGLFDKLAARYDEMGATKRIAGLIQALDGKDVPVSLRTGVRVFEFLTRWQSDPTLYSKAGAMRTYAEDGEKLLAEAPDHAKADDVVKALFNYGLGRAFDVPAKTAAMTGRLEEKAATMKDPATLRRHINKLSELSTNHVKQIEEQLKKLKNQPKGGNGSDFLRGFYAAQLGDAETAVRILSEAPPSFIDRAPMAKELLAEAKEKLAKEKKQ